MVPDQADQRLQAVWEHQVEGEQAVEFLQQAGFSDGAEALTLEPEGVGDRPDDVLGLLGSGVGGEVQIDGAYRGALSWSVARAIGGEACDAMPGSAWLTKSRILSTVPIFTWAGKLRRMASSGTSRRMNGCRNRAWRGRDRGSDEPLSASRGAAPRAARTSPRGSSSKGRS